MHFVLTVMIAKINTFDKQQTQSNTFEENSTQITKTFQIKESNFSRQINAQKMNLIDLSILVLTYVLSNQ